MPTLNWIGKEKIVNHHNDVVFRTLEKKYSYGEENSGNMIIHGDNLEALKALLPRYEGRIKCIYIDPPYNTGNENWVYNDNVNDPRIKKWLGEVVGKESDDLSRHDKWLCMMYPRLVLLQRLLSEDGAIFISIDDNEVANLKLICDEIFMQKHICSVCVKNDSRNRPYDSISVSHEYLLIYSGRKFISNILHNTDKKFDYYDGLGGYDLYELRNRNSDFNIDNRPNLYYPFWLNPQNELENGLFEIDLIEHANWIKVYPQESQGIKTVWRWNKEKSSANLNVALFGHECKNGWQIVKKYREDTYSLSSVWDDNEISSDYGTLSLKKCFNNKRIFAFPKSPELIKRCIKLSADKDSIVLDSFAGSGTTAQAVLEMNKQDGGNRKFILCEMCDYAEDITAKRVKKIIDGYDFKGKEEEILYSQKLTIKNLDNYKLYIEEAENVIDTKASDYDKISNPALKGNCIQVIGTKIYDGKKDGLGGGFDFYELGDTIFDSKSGLLNDNAPLESIREYVWFTETNIPYNKPEDISNEYLLGRKDEVDYYLYYKQGEETTLNWDFLGSIRRKAEQYIIYADRCLLDPEEMQKHNIVYKKIPRDIKHV